MNNNNITKLINNIVYIEDKNTESKIKYKKITCDKLTAKYSNTKIPIFKLKIDDKLINRNNPYRVKYKCINCEKENLVNLNNIARKINKNITDCNNCKNSNLDKRINQSLFMLNKPNNYEKHIKDKICNKEIINISDEEFNKEDFEFQHNYYRKHLTKEEFDHIKSKILSIQHDKFRDISKMIYCPAIKIHNQTKYNPYLYDNDNDNFEKINYIKYKCDVCDQNFINRDIFIQKNKFKILCKDCNFTNNIFKIRNTKNINNKKITYQSKLELKFINYCNKNNIIVEDGEKINYIFNNKKRRYIVDFFLPQLNMLIELKDNHCWHKKNKQSGIWDAKLKAVDELIKNKKYNSFIVIYSNNLLNECELIKKKIY